MYKKVYKNMQFDLRKFIKAADLTLDETAEYIGYRSRQGLTKSLGRGNLSIERRLKLAEFLEKKHAIRRALRLPPPGA